MIEKLIVPKEIIPAIFADIHEEYSTSNDLEKGAKTLAALICALSAE